MTKKELLNKLDNVVGVETTYVNHIKVNFTNGYMFVSYDSIVVINVDGETYLTQYWNYSRTTERETAKVLGMATKELKEKALSGEYKTVVI